MRYSGKVEDPVFGELYDEVVMFERLLTKVCERLAFRDVCKYSGGGMVIFHLSKVFEGRLVFSGNGVFVSIALNSDDPVGALVAFSRDPEHWFEKLERDFERVVEKYVGDYKKMERVLTRESPERQISSP